MDKTKSKKLKVNYKNFKGSKSKKMRNNKDIVHKIVDNVIKGQVVKIEPKDIFEGFKDKKTK
tara:strand:- start:2893 stop:3078 length:186 start_codon:yes stop_codon:yes gene_type:complete